VFALLLSYFHRKSNLRFVVRASPVLYKEKVLHISFEKPFRVFSKNSAIKYSKIRSATRKNTVRVLFGRLPSDWYTALECSHLFYVNAEKVF
jgi:hypothetical protein